MNMKRDASEVIAACPFCSDALEMAGAGYMHPLNNGTRPFCLLSGMTVLPHHVEFWNRRPAAEPADAGRDVVAVPREVFDWLMGENGTFECDPAHYFRGRAPAYWWRSELLRRIASQQAVKP